MSVFIVGFYVLLVLCAVLLFFTRSTVQYAKDAQFSRFQRVYLVVYLLAVAGDWLQGPYVYALYQSYGMTSHDIEILFVAGFGSSLLFGTVVGSVADKYGRRFNCILYGVLYGLSCVTKHFNNFHILMVGRLLGGIATSILYSAFESWLIYEHRKHNFADDLLGILFSNAVLGNSIVAIVAGLVSQQFADRFGFVAPFDLSLLLMVIMCSLLVLTWSENYGDATAKPIESFKRAVTVLRSNQKVLCLGLVQSLFEGAMYTFVLEWTPALDATVPTKAPPASRVGVSPGNLDDHDGDGHRGTIPHGYIFASFMVSIMIGSSLFKLLMKSSQPESFMRPVLLVAGVSLVTPILFAGNQLIIFVGFLVFETCVGVFWPAMSTMRGKHVPEESRATIMNFFRIPLNLIVVVILTQSLPMLVIFRCCVIFLLIAAVAQHYLHRQTLHSTLPNSAAGPPSPTVATGDKERLMNSNDLDA